MSRWLVTAALLAALAPSGCGPSAATGSNKGAAPTTTAPAHTGKVPDTARDTGRGAAHHDPG